MATKLPENFPGRKALEAAGVTTREELEALDDEALNAIDGIGPKTSADIGAFDWDAPEEKGDAAKTGDEAKQPATQQPQPGTAAADEGVKVGTHKSAKGTVTETFDAK